MVPDLHVLPPCEEHHLLSWLTLSHLALQVPYSPPKTETPPPAGCSLQRAFIYARTQPLLGLLVMNTPDRDFVNLLVHPKQRHFHLFAKSPRYFHVSFQTWWACGLRQRWAVDSSSGVQKRRERFSIFCSVVPVRMEDSAVTAGAGGFGPGTNPWDLKVWCSKGTSITRVFSDLKMLPVP